MDVTQIARVCHEANKAFCESIGDFSQMPWDEAEDWQQVSAINGVEFAINNPDAPAWAQHDAWMSDKVKDGWKYGPIKNPLIKEHPCLVAFSELPTDQRIKDHLFKGIVKAFIEGRNGR